MHVRGPEVPSGNPLWGLAQKKVETAWRKPSVFDAQVISNGADVLKAAHFVGNCSRITLFQEGKSMNLIKCPRCDLNYIREDEKYCKVCLREMKGEKQAEEMELCSVCNEEPCLPGKDVCLFCLKEMNKSNNEEDTEEETDPVDTNTIGDMDDVSGMDEIIPEVEEDESSEYDEIEQELSLEDVREDEERDADDEEEEEQ